MFLYHCVPHSKTNKTLVLTGKARTLYALIIVLSPQYNLQKLEFDIFRKYHPCPLFSEEDLDTMYLS